MTTQQLTLDPAHTAVLIMDFAQNIVDNYASDPPGVVQHAAEVLAAARKTGVPVMYVMPGGPGRDPAVIHPGVAPAADEVTILKERMGSFSTTGLDARLRQMGRDTLVLMGVATSGCVLSTARWGFDLNYKQIVVTDGCSDPNPDVHKLLTQQVHPNSFVGLWRLAQMATAREVSAALA